MAQQDRTFWSIKARSGKGKLRLGRVINLISIGGPDIIYSRWTAEVAVNKQ